MVASINGMIADKDGNEDFLSHRNWEEFISASKDIGNFIIGRKTYEAVQSWGEGYSFDNFSDLDRVIVSRQDNFAAHGYTIANSAESALKALQEKGHKTALVVGGSTINSLFANKLDEIRLNIEPIVVGEGIPLFNPADFTLPLELIESVNIGDGITQLRYQVLK